ncbi:MAG: hypothetical protein WKG01_29795 [Kofleriaceae bacterium]
MKRVQLFERLPAFHKIQDAELGGPLQAFLAPVEAAFDAVKDSIEALYHDLFIDTCAAWVIPYIGDLVGTSHLAGDPQTLRADVADTIFLRRAKGTLGAIERLAHDLTGWAAHPVELRENLVWAQALNHQRPDRGGAPAYAQPPFGRHTVIRGGFATIRDPAVLAEIDTPYDTFARFPDVSIARAHSLAYTLPNLAIFVWRLASYAIELQRRLATPSPAVVSTAACPSRGSTSTARAAGAAVRPLDVRSGSPARAADATRCAARADRARAARAGARGTDRRRKPIGVRPRERVRPGAPIEQGGLPIELYVPLGLPRDWTIRGANLCAWEGGLAPPLAANEIAIDPVIGRIAIGAASQASADMLVEQLVISYRYGAVGPVGAHPVARDETPGLPLAIVVDGQPGAPTLEDALAELATITDVPLVIELADDQIHELDANNVGGSGDLVVGRPLYLRAADGRRPIVRLAQPLRFVSSTLDDRAVTTLVRMDGLMLVGGGLAAADPLIARVAIAGLDLRGCTLDPGGHRVLDGSIDGARAPARAACAWRRLWLLARRPRGLRPRPDRRSHADDYGLAVHRG